ncbi:MAG: CHAT domain-containing protein [Myxococcales bacterium]|nr:CHAT domain-containing protein [Myxococcales bacterium]MCB9716020.1 CHAT domain-containing protein [Myxococcales bacterium]
MERSTRQTVIAALWEAQGHDELLELLASTPRARDHELIHAVHEQSLDCRRSAPDFAAHLERVAGWLAEIHAGLRAAEPIASLRELLQWQVDAPWRLSAAMERLLAARAASTDPAKWPWEIGRLPALRAELDHLLLGARRMHEVPAASWTRRLEEEPRLQWPELASWLSLRVGLGDPAAAGLEAVHRQVVALQRLRSPERGDDPEGRRRREVMALGELVELWYRLDPVLDRTCEALEVEVVAGQRPLTEALRAVAAGAAEPVRNLHRRAYLLYHLLDQGSPSVRNAALGGLAGLVASPEAQQLGRIQRAILVQRWAVAVVLHWHVLDEPTVVLPAVLQAVNRCLPGVVDGSSPRIARDLMITRARVLRAWAGWRDDRLEEAVRAYELALGELEAQPDPMVHGRTRAELAGLLRSRRSSDPREQDRRIRRLYDDALGELLDSVVLRARVLADYSVYLARPLCGPSDEDGEQAVVLAQRAVELLSGLPGAVQEHPLLRTELAVTLSILGNVWLESGRGELRARHEAAAEAYRDGLARVGETNELVAGLLHLDLALVALASTWQRRRERLALARRELELAEPRLRPLPVAHGRAVAERAMLAVRAEPEDERVRKEAIREVEAALSRLPVGSDPAVRARVQRQLGDLFLGRDGPDDPQRAAEQLAAARSAFIEGGAARLAVEVARDYAESQIRLHADEGDPAALTRGEAVLEQAALLAERRWASRRASEPTAKLEAMLDGVYGDLAWLRAKLGRPVEVVLHAACRAKRFRPSPSLRDLETRAERSSMLRPVHLDSLARRVPPPSREARGSAGLGPTPVEIRARCEAFVAANPRALGLDITLTRWGTVVSAVSEQGLAYVTLPLTRETVRRWVWGDDGSPGWRRGQLAVEEARGGARAPELERAWEDANDRLAADIGRRLLDPALASLGCSLDGRRVLLAAGRVAGLPLAAARVGAKALVERVEGLALVPSLTALPRRSIVAHKPRRALCVLVEEQLDAAAAIATEELRDVVRLLASAGAEVEILARLGNSLPEGLLAPLQAKTRERLRLGDSAPSMEAVLARVDAVDHFYCAGHGGGSGLALVEAAGAAPVDPEAIAAGPRWRSGSSVLLGGGSRREVERSEPWPVVEALRAAGVGFVVTSTGPVPDAFAHAFCRSFYLYWALGRGIPEACVAALVKEAGADAAKQGAFVVAMGSLDADEQGPDPAA